MKNCKIVLAAALLAAACTPKASISGMLEGAPGHEVEVRELNVNVWKVLDTVKTNSSCAFHYNVPVEKGQPEFIYLYHNGTKIASLLLHSGDKVTVVADTLGNCTVEGSEDSRYLVENEKRFAVFASEFQRLDAAGGQGQAMARLFVEHYRENVRFLMEHPYSMADVPLLYESLNEYTPVFNQNTDAILFRGVCDSLKTVYPDSRYVKALEKETVRREQIMGMNNRIAGASEADYPDLRLPGIDGKEVSLADMENKAVILHFWDPSDAEQKMFNVDVLKPVYDRWHSRGLEIYAVGVSADKPEWASVVKAQELPWINVCDGQGTASQALRWYNVGNLPSSILVTKSRGLVPVEGGVPGLEKELARELK